MTGQEQPGTETQTPAPVAGAGFSHSRLRLYQAFVNIEGIRVPIRHPLLNFLPWRYRPSRIFGFYAVLMLAAEDGTRPPMLLSMTQQVLADHFGQMSRTEPDSWVCKMEQWREVGVAPPMFQQPGCVDDGWGAAWYVLGDEKAKAQRYRLTKLRLWKGRRAKQRGLQLHQTEADARHSKAPVTNSETKVEKNQVQMQPM